MAHHGSTLTMNTFFMARTACPACRSPRRETVYACDYLANPVRDFLVNYYRQSGRLDLAYLEGVRYLLEECCDCGLVYQSQVPSDSLNEILYREKPIPPPPEECGHSLSYHARNVERLMSLAAYLSRKSSDIRICDFGFGWAEWISLGVALGFQACGCELTEVKKEFARSRGVQVMEWDQIPGAGFDYIHCDWVFEHLREPRDTLEQLVRGLRVGGLIMISVPYRHHIQRRLKADRWNVPRDSRKSLNAVHPMEHINCWEGCSLNRMAEACGLRPIKIPVRRQRMILSWDQPREAVKSLLRPFYHNGYPWHDERYFERTA
jgi:SAM-dependent methyltransferase